MPRIKPTTSYNTPRYGEGPILEDAHGINLEDVNGNLLIGSNGSQVNVIDTIWDTTNRHAEGLWYDNIFPWLITFLPWQYGPGIITRYNTPRYGEGPILEDAHGVNLEDVDGNLLIGSNGSQVNVIETIWN